MIAFNGAALLIVAVAWGLGTAWFLARAADVAQRGQRPVPPAPERQMPEEVGQR